jgi:hypothetical protein
MHRATTELATSRHDLNYKLKKAPNQRGLFVFRSSFEDSKRKSEISLNAGNPHITSGLPYGLT